MASVDRIPVAHAPEGSYRGRIEQCGGRVAAAFEAGTLVLRPVGMPGVEVVRRRGGDGLVGRSTW